MMLADIVLGARHWLLPAVGISLAVLAVIIWSYRGTIGSVRLRATCAALKGVGIILLAVCLVEPLYTGTRPRPGSNLFLVVADNSRSLQLADSRSTQTRGQTIQTELAESSPWLTRLAQDFEVRKYAFDTILSPKNEFSSLTFDGEASALRATLAAFQQRFQGHPVAGILLFTDGNATDMAAEFDWKSLPPVYPVAVASEAEAVDLAVRQVAVSQTNFEASPVTLAVELEGQSVAGRKVVVRVLDDAGKVIERRLVPVARDDQSLAQRFLIKPDRPGVLFYEVHASLEGEESLRDKPGRTAEATLANNRRLVTVDRGGGPYRVLYVGGSPNWEFKFLRRAIESDDEVRLAALMRVAKKEPKFAFLGRSGERTNPLFRGFDNQADEQAEQYDEPVLIRLGTEDKDELLDGFPKHSEDLFRYHAVILDDIEAAFFTQDQLSLLQQFVSQRGGGLLMLGGKGSFGEGGYDRTPVGEMLPVYLDRASHPPSSGGVRLKLTREGWLQPWLRVRSTEPEESQRLAGMPAFQSLNVVQTIKPGASVLAEVEANDSAARPALVVQPFGRGRAAALLVGDLWRWELRRSDADQSDLQKSWRQTVRWLVADVPQPMEFEVRRSESLGLGGRDILVRVRDKQFEPLDNAAVTLKITTPEGRELEMTADSSDETPGEYVVHFVPRTAGPYRARVVASAPDGSSVGERETGWTVEPQTEEFKQLRGNRPLLERIAHETGGEVIEPGDLDQFVRSLPTRKIPIVENWSYPLWHQWSVLVVAIGCLVGEWGLRRWRGLP